MLKFDIAGVLIEIISIRTDYVSQIKPFISSNQQNADIEISLTPREYIFAPQTKVVQDEYSQWFRNTDNDCISICIYKFETKEIIYLIQADSNWKKVSITYLVNDPRFESIIAGGLGEVIFRNRLLFHQGILIHAVALIWESIGIMFSAPSGTGKSTQANLWKKFMGAVVLNGDRSAVRFIDNKPYVYGTPWCGSSNEYLNQRVPLHIIIILEQSQENIIRRLDNHEAISRLMPRCFLPYYDGGDIMNHALENIEKVISVTPIYLLKCRPDEEAVKMVYECLK